MDIWQELYEKAQPLYQPKRISPFLKGHEVVCALEAENGEIFTGFNIESSCGVMDLCAERVAALSMYKESGQRIVKKVICFRDRPPEGILGMPCGACREFFLQLSYENMETEFLVDYEKRETVKLRELIPRWWGEYKLEKNDKN